MEKKKKFQLLLKEKENLIQVVSIMSENLQKTS